MFLCMRSLSNIEKTVWQDEVEIIENKMLEEIWVRNEHMEYETTGGQRS